MEHLIVCCRNRPLAVVVILFLITMFFLFQVLTNLKLDASIDGMIIKNNRDYLDYQETKKEFVTDNTSLIYIKDDEIFSKEILTAIDEVFYQLEETPGVVRIDSLFNVRNFNGTSGTLEINPLIQYIPDNEEIEDLKRIEGNAIRNPLLARNLISDDGSIAIINVLAENTEHEKEFNMRMANDIEAALEKIKGKVERVFQLGTPYRRDLISRSILGDLSTLIPLALFVVLVVLAVLLKSLNGAVIPIITGSLSVLWTLGFMAFWGIPVTILTAIVPPMLLALGCTEDIHIISEYFEGLQAGLSRFDAVQFLAPQIGNAILLTGITTFLGCLSITFNEINLLKQFGVAAAFGIIANFVITVSLVPVYLRYFGSEKAPIQGKSGFSIYHTLARGICHIVLHHKKPAIVASLVIVVGLGAGIPEVKIDNNLIGYFRKDSPIRKRSDELNQKIAGSEIFYIVLSSRQKNAFKDHEYLKMILEIQAFIKAKGDFDFSLSVADHVALVERETNYGKPEHYTIPESKETIAQHLLLFHRHDLDRYINYGYDKANIIVRHNISSSYELKQALAGLESYITKKHGDKITFLFTGENILLLKATDTMAAGLAKSLLFMFLFIFLLISILFRDLKLGLISLIPNAVPIIMIFGVMGYFNIPLNTGTTMIAVISIGVAVDDTIHLMTRFRHAFNQGFSMEKAVKSVIRAEVRPVFASTVALTAGFSVLGQSNFMPVVYFGILSGAVMVFAFFADLVVTPVVITLVSTNPAEANQTGQAPPMN